MQKLQYKYIYIDLKFTSYAINTKHIYMQFYQKTNFQTKLFIQEYWLTLAIGESRELIH